MVVAARIETKEEAPDSYVVVAVDIMIAYKIQKRRMKQIIYYHQQQQQQQQ